MKVILLNGPPRSGKDFAGRVLQNLIHRSRCVKMAKQLKERCHAAYLLFDGQWRRLPHDAFEYRKDEPTFEFEGMTPRQAYIAFSENWIKPTFGKGQLGVWLLREMQDIDPFGAEEITYIVTDCGFRDEAAEIIKKTGAENVRLIRIHRQGCDFVNDSRSYLDLSDLGAIGCSVWNAGDETFATKLKEVL